MKDKKLQDRYELIVCALIANGGSAYLDELTKLTNLTESRITKALQYGRRYFDFENRSAQDYVMAHGGGYFLTDDKNLAVAYTVQTLKDVLSRAKTLKALYAYIKEKYPDELSEAMNQSFDDGTDETEPWAVFNNLINNFDGGNK